MRKSYTFLILAALWVWIGNASNAHAMGYGAYLSYGGGASNWTAERNYGEWEFGMDDTAIGIGFVLDTAAARDTLFNYRLELGFEALNATTTVSKEKYHLYGLAMTHDYGFGIVRTRGLRLWLGPELKFALLGGGLEDDDTFDMTMVYFGLGPAVGLNFNIGNRFTLAVKTSYLLQLFSGVGESENLYIEDATYSGSSGRFVVNFAIMFRNQYDRIDSGY